VAPGLALPGPVTRAPALGVVTCRHLCHADPGGKWDPLAIPGSLLGWNRLFRLGNGMVLAVGSRLFACPRLAGLVGAGGYTPTSAVSDRGRCGVAIWFVAGFGKRSDRGDPWIAIGHIEVAVR